ncbi:SH3 domain-containing C40 family peptidase [Helicobacter mesocricetorum]|uniref:SH3 domain-containing C40 family peptidase n=1 Tax=Helicobacter mesocricetorum TaxID=87012 RepID=UPI000CF1577E|nr:SH3 domain-containing C40 family peptidase [Helicobacter mesocricetorum]
MVKTIQLSSFIFLLFILLGCAQITPTPAEIDLSLPKQDLTLYAKDTRVFKDSAKLKKHYLKNFFLPFNQEPQLNVLDIQWGLTAAYANRGFGENLLPYTTDFLDNIKQEMNLENFPNAKKPAIITRSTNLRVIPTHKPRFLDPKLPGEGFPFDTWQNSSIYAGTPILITHYSQSKEWAFVESGFVSGWVSILDIALLKPDQIRLLESTKDFLVTKKDYAPIRSSNNVFLESARIGMLLPLIGSTKKTYESLFFIRTSSGYAKAVKTHLPVKNFTKFPMPFSSVNYAYLTQDIVGEKYGWGGMFGNRDCSMFLHDTLGNFGFYLSRNSQAQIKQKDFQDRYLYVDLSQKTPQEKVDFLKENGIPFATLLGMKGHIMLYLGVFNDEILAIHDIWGLRTLQNEKEGRKILGKIIITPLDIGKGVETISQNSLLINRISGMRNLFDENELKNAK